MNTIEMENKLGITFCKRQQLVIERGKGSYVWDEQGNKYLDFTSGWGVTCLGHSHPVIVNSIIKQSQKIMQNPNSGFTYSPARANILCKLHEVLPRGLDKIYFANSGAEANDAALKLARKITGKSKVISMLGSFHGRTFNTLSVSTGLENTEKYLPPSSQTRFVQFNDMSALSRELDDNTAAVILEPIQGEGGVRIPEPGYIQELSAACKKHQALLIVDEVQTGFCRTGNFFAIEKYLEGGDIDILTMGKGIAGGFPFAAFAISAAVDRGIVLGDHGGTYCGNPLGCAIAADVVAYLKDNNIAERVRLMGEGLESRLNILREKHRSIVESVRGKGLLWALQLSDDKAVELLTSACLHHGLLVTPTRNGVLRLIPSLLLNNEELSEAVEALDSALSSVVHIHGVK